jgi:two-component system OmpR family sensor kinase
MSTEGSVSTPTRVTAVYLLAGLAWILASDTLVVLLVPTEYTAFVQSTKGALFVGASAILLWTLTDRASRQLADRNRELERALSRMSILHRVLRHDLRNAGNVIAGYAHELDEEYDDGRLAPIIERAERLTELSERTEHLRTLEIDAARSPTDGLAALHSVAERYQCDRLAVVLPDESAPVSTDVDTIAAELVENALAYADEAVLTARVTDETLEFSVVDDGPGLPELEREVLESSLEEPLRHSRGLGLWTVQFIVDRAGGEIRFVDNEPSGTVAVVSLPLSDRGRQT